MLLIFGRIDLKIFGVSGVGNLLYLFGVFSGLIIFFEYLIWNVDIFIIVNKENW